MDHPSPIDELEALLERSIRVPASGKLLVDENALRALIAAMRHLSPDELRYGTQATGERERMLADARAQAHRIIAEAQAQANRRVDDQAIVQAARTRAHTIVTEAEQQAAQLQAQANQYVQAHLNSLEQRLDRLLREVQAGQRFLLQEAKGEDEAKSGRKS